MLDKVVLDIEAQIEIADQVVEIALEQQKALDNNNLDDFIELGRERGDLIQYLHTMQNSARAVSISSLMETLILSLLRT